jgi:hypothetical protein
VTPQERLAQINQTLEAVRSGWPFLLAVMQGRVNDLTETLIGNNDEQIRGRIKQLRELMDLPQTLQQEREGIEAGLAD